MVLSGINSVKLFLYLPSVVINFVFVCWYGFCVSEVLCRKLRCSGIDMIGSLMHCWAGHWNCDGIVLCACVLIVQMLRGECWLTTAVLLQQTPHNDSINSLLLGMNNTFCTNSIPTISLSVWLNSDFRYLQIVLHGPPEQQRLNTEK